MFLPALVALVYDFRTYNFFNISRFLGTHIVVLDIGQSLDAQRLGQVEQHGNLLLVDVHLAGVHEGKQRYDGPEAGSGYDDHGMVTRLQSPEDVHEEAATGTQDHAMGPQLAALGRDGHIREMRLVQQNGQGAQQAGLEGNQDQGDE